MLILLGEFLLRIIMKPDPSLVIERHGWAGAACIYIGIPLAIGFAAYFVLRNMRKNSSKKA